MKKALIFAAVAEAATGLALLIVPSLVGQLLLGEELTGIAIPVARVAGIALIGLGIACWPGPPLVGMLIYSAVVTLYLAYLGFAGGLTGVFLWPAVALHARSVNPSRSRLEREPDLTQSSSNIFLGGNGNGFIGWRIGLCVPKTSSALIGRKNHLKSAQHDCAVVLVPAVLASVALVKAESRRSNFVGVELTRGDQFRFAFHL